MGLAASQARYLSLSARKTNCEYEGQQLNQQRLTLSNQSADLFNQMLTMSVPTPPNTSEFTKLQYSWSDGNFTSVIDSYYQIGKPDEKYNYVVSSYHYENVYTGQRKFLSDPQVQAKKTNHFSDLKDKTYRVDNVSYNLEKDTYTLELYNTAMQTSFNATYRLSDQNSNKDTTEQLDFMYSTNRISSTDTDATKYVYDDTATPPTVTYDGTTVYTYVDPETDRDTLNKLKMTYGAFYDTTKKYFKSASDEYICWDDISTTQLTKQGDVVVRKEDTRKYYTDGTNYVPEATLRAIKVGDPVLGNLTVQSAINNPTFSDYKSIGNCALTQISEEMYKEDITLETEIQQILKDMGSDKGDAVSYQRLKNCFDEHGNYINGSLYKFTMAGKTYYTTHEDMDESLKSAYNISSVADNSIDSQQSKLAYYNALYIETKVSEVKKALLETDGKGRFSTVKFEDDSVVYTLNVETIKDDDAYNDAMNKYFFEKEKYDKQIADINAKTEIIQAQDRQLQLKLEQLGTEQTALQTEMEACQKVVSKNIENSFKTFGN